MRDRVLMLAVAALLGGCAFRGAGRSIMGGPVPSADYPPPAAPVVVIGGGQAARPLLPLEIVARDADGLPWGIATLQGLDADGRIIEVTTDTHGIARTAAYSPAIPRWRAAKEGGGWSRVLVTPASVPLEDRPGWRLIVTVVEAAGGEK